MSVNGPSCARHIIGGFARFSSWLCERVVPAGFRREFLGSGEFRLEVGELSDTKVSSAYQLLIYYFSTVEEQVQGLRQTVCLLLGFQWCASSTHRSG